MAQAWNTSILQSHHWNYDAMLYRHVLCHLQGVGGREQHPLRDRSIPLVHILPLPAPPCCCLHTKPRWVRSATSPLLILLGAEHAQGHPSQEDEAGKSVSSSKSITIFFFSLHAWTSPNTYSHICLCAPVPSSTSRAQNSQAALTGGAWDSGLQQQQAAGCTKPPTRQGSVAF